MKNDLHNELSGYELHKYNAAEAEKASVALNSVFAATALTAMKIVVGIMTGSLGILAEAAHSALDLVAAFITWIAVQLGGKPADREHPYGHGKIENLSAMFEAFLLLLTCGWIIYEAVHRLMADEPAVVHVTIWAFAVVIISIIVDISRSRMLYAAAKKHNSQALEADALHFSSDIYSSAVVLLGLICVKVAENYPNHVWLKHADSVAALLVALIVIGVSLKLGKRTVDVLLDTSPDGAQEELLAMVEKIHGVVDSHRVRIRVSGPKMFVDAHVSMDGKLSLKQAHELMDTIEAQIQARYPGADVTIHPEPVQMSAIMERKSLGV